MDDRVQQWLDLDGDTLILLPILGRIDLGQLQQVLHQSLHSGRFRQDNPGKMATVGGMVGGAVHQCFGEAANRGQRR